MGRRIGNLISVNNLLKRNSDQSRTDDLISLLIPTCILFHLAFAPYTKVEESFNVQATHDILTYGVPLRDADRKLHEWYDHLTFSGSVPRTFVGPLALAGASQPVIWVVRALGVAIDRQILVRAILGLFNAYCLISFRNRVAKAFGRNAANWYALLQASQFHSMFYASRTLPNFFALGLTTLAARNLLPLAGRSPSSRSSRKRQTTAIILLTVTTVIFRSELAILLGCYSLYLSLHPYIRLPIRSIVISGIIGTSLGLLLSIPPDTFFWRSPIPLWPELTAFKYNILNSKASEWGTSPWHFYFTSSLPRLLFNPFVIFLLPFTLSISILRGPALDILIPQFMYIAIYSFQPHKEWRFIIYTVAPLLAVASAGASWIWTRRRKTFVYRLLSLTLVSSLLASFAVNAVMCAISRLNYPGAEALQLLHDIGSPMHGEPATVKVHLDTLACTTGVTRFMQKPSARGANNETLSWIYDKSEDKTQLRDPRFWETMDYALAENLADCLGEWQPLATVYGFAGLRSIRPGEQEDHVSMNRIELSKEVSGILERKRTYEKWHKHYIHHVGRRVEDLYDACRIFLRAKVTRGWWIGIRMDPKIRILKRVLPVNVNIEEVEGEEADTEPMWLENKAQDVDERGQDHLE